MTMNLCFNMPEIIAICVTVILVTYIKNRK